MTNRLASILKIPAARDGALVVGAQGLSALIALGVSSLLYHKLPMAEQGALSAGSSLSNTLLQFSDLGVALITIRLGARYIAEGRRAKAAALFRATLRLRVAAATLTILVAEACAGNLARDLLSMAHGRTLVLGATLGVFGNALAWWGIDVAQARRDMRAYAAQQIAGAVAKAAAVGAVFALLLKAAGNGAAENMLFAIAAANLCSGAFGLVLMRRAAATPAEPDAPEPGASPAIRFGEFGAYACAISILMALSTNADIFLVQHFLKEEDTAVFNCARQLALVLNLLATACITVLLPRAAALDSPAACAAYVRKALKAGVALALVAAGGLALAAGIFVPLFGGPRYTASIPILQWLCLAQGIGILLTPLTLVFYPLRREGMLVSLNALQLAAQIALGIWLTPAYRLEGAAWALLGAKFALAAATVVALARAFGRNWNGEPRAGALGSENR